MRKTISTLAVLAALAVAPVAAHAQAVAPTAANTLSLGTSGISGLQAEGGLSINGQTDMVGGVQPGMAESGGGSVYTTDTSTIAPAQLSATTTGFTTGTQSSQITDTNIAAGQTAWTSNDVFGESETMTGLTTNVPDLTGTHDAPALGWSN